MIKRVRAIALTTGRGDRASELRARLLGALLAAVMAVFGLAAGVPASASVHKAALQSGPAVARAPDPIVNGGFETGSFSGWSTSGPSTTIVSSGAHSGNYAAMAGSASETSGDSDIIQTFTAAPGDTTLSFWYDVTCADSVAHDWATVTLRDNTSGTTGTPLAPTCVANSGWQQVTTAIMAGHSYTLTLTNHDSCCNGPVSTLFDDVAVTGPSTVTVSESGTGTGTVTSSPAGISCPGTCSANFGPGTSVTLSATPPAGGVFTGWSGPCHGMGSSTCTFTVNSNTSVGASFTASATLTQENGAGVSYTGTWKVSNCQCFSGGHTLYTTAKGNNATFKFTGNLVQVVSEKSPTRGSFKVYMDGTYKATVNNYRTFTRNGIIVWQQTFATVGKHTLKIVNLATSRHPRTDVDAFVVAK